MPASPPLMPMITFPSRASGAAVMLWPVLLLATSTSQRTAPERVSRATRCASSVPTYSMSSRMAGPRFVRPKPNVRSSFGSARSYFQSSRPARRSSAFTAWIWLPGSVRYITPSATSGDVCSVPGASAWNIHTGFKWDTFCAVISASGEKRWPA